MLRRKGGRLLWGTGVIAVLVVSIGVLHLARTRRPPKVRELARGMSVLLITVDTLRADRLGCYGYERARTSTIDSLAQCGYQFLGAHAQVTTTVPSHASIMTSLYVRSHNVVGNEGMLDQGALTLAEVLADSGYLTAAVIGVAFMGTESGVAQGFHTVDAPRLGERSAVAVSRIASAWIDSVAASDRRFFLWVHYFDPHVPYNPPLQFRERLGGYDGRYLRSLEIHDMRALNAAGGRSLGESDLAQINMLYDGEVAHVDLEIGRLLRVLRRTGIAGRTMVLVMADHGESHGEHGIFCDHFGLYEPTTRIPLILAIPGQPRGRPVACLVQSIDVMPTILDLLGVAVPAGVEGRSLVPALEGHGIEVNEGSYSELVGQLQASVRTSNWKLIVGLRTYTLDSGLSTQQGSVELYDLKADPAERVNLATDRPDQVAVLRDSYASWRQRTGPRWGRASQLDEQTRMSLRELGYLQ
jgi:arylsulfatase A-like enzyme